MTRGVFLLGGSKHVLRLSKGCASVDLDWGPASGGALRINRAVAHFSVFWVLFEI